MKMILEAIAVSVFAYTLRASQPVALISAYIDAKISRNYPGFEGLAIDSLGKEHFPLIIIRPPTNLYPVQVAHHGSLVKYRRLGASRSAPPRWKIEIRKKEIRLESQ